MLSDADTLRDQFIRNMRAVPGAVAVVAADDGRERSGLTATAWNSLSADPPMLLACINRQARAHGAITRAGAFSVNLLARGAGELGAVFAGQRGLDGDDRFAEGEWEKGVLGQPLLLSAVAAFECQLEATYDHGSHTIVIGRVGDMRARGEGQALLYVDGNFAAAIRDD